MKIALQERGMWISEWVIRRVMRENGMYPRTTRKFRPGHKGNSDGRFYENMIEQDFSCESMNKKWVGDITYLRTNQGWIYLAAVMDLYNREIIGYAISKKCDTELVCRALRNAVARRGNSREGLIFHSDRGCQYSSKKYQKLLDEYRITGSMSKAGCPYDNSCMESFYASLKKEYIRRKEYATLEAIRADLFYYIELFYNRKRLHASLGYMSPIAYRLKMTGKEAV